MLIGLNGRKQAGKDTTYERIASIWGPLGATVERASFADLLYRSAAAALGVTVEQLQKWKTDPYCLVQVRRVNVAYEPPIVTTHASVSIREYLQNYGTEAHRDIFGTNFWVEQVDLDHDDKIVVVTDVRFANEAQAIADAGGSVVRVLGPLTVEGEAEEHASEAPLPPALVDFMLDNSVRGDAFVTLDTHLRALLMRLLREGRRACV